MYRKKNLSVWNYLLLAFMFMLKKLPTFLILFFLKTNIFLFSYGIFYTFWRYFDIFRLKQCVFTHCCQVILEYIEFFNCVVILSKSSDGGHILKLITRKKAPWPHFSECFTTYKCIDFNYGKYKKNLCVRNYCNVCL